MIKLEDVRAIRPLLQQFFFGFWPSMQPLISRELIPEIDGKDISGQIWSQSAADAFRLWDDSTDQGVARQVQFGLTTTNWDSRLRALKFVLENRVNLGSQAPFPLASALLAQCLNALWLNCERRAAVALNDTGTFTNTAADAAFGAAGSNPVGDITDAINTGSDAAVVPYNTVIFGSPAIWTRWTQEPDVRDYISSTLSGLNQARVMTPQMAANALNVRGAQDFRVYIASARYNSADFGQAASMQNVWTGTNVIVGHFPRKLPQNAPAGPTPDGFGTRVAVGQPGAFDGTPTPLATIFGLEHGKIREWEQDEPEGIAVRPDFDYIHKVGKTECAYILTGC